MPPQQRESGPPGGRDRAEPLRWTPRRRLAAAGFLTFLTVQILVPALQLLADRPARFGWQMFAGLREMPDILVVRPGGWVDTLPLRRYVGYPRAEMVFGPDLARYVCRRDPGAVAVVLRYPGRSAPAVTCD
jgi:hypothetical protein